MRINRLTSISFSGRRENNREFKALKQQISEDIAPLYHENSLASWNFNVNTTDENRQKSEAASSALNDYFSNRDLYDKLLKIKINGGVSNEHDKKLLERLLRSFAATVDYKEQIDNMIEKESAILQKLSQYQKTIDGKPVTTAEIEKIIRESKDVELRKKADSADNAQGDVVADDIIRLIKERNEFARKLGYPNFYDYVTTTSYNISAEELAELYDKIYSQLKSQNDKRCEKRKVNIAKKFGITPDEVREYHRGFLTKGSLQKNTEQAIKSKEQVIDFCKKIYKQMGYDIDKLPILLDLFARTNKTNNNFCSDIEPCKDIRISANLDANIYSVETLMHELGHAVFDAYNNPNHNRLEYYPTATMTEAIALMMGGLPATEGLFKGMVSDKTNAKFQKASVENDINSVISLLRYSDFERQLYLNPNQDVQKLWRDIQVKYYRHSPDEKLTNHWATIPHYTSYPAYCQNYFRAELIRAQLYEELAKRFGKISENKEVAKFLNENIFQYGGTKEDDEILEAITGKKLEPDAFTKKAKKFKIQ